MGLWHNKNLRYNSDWDFCSSVVKTLCFHCKGHRFDPWLEKYGPKCDWWRWKKKGSGFKIQWAKVGGNWKALVEKAMAPHSGTLAWKIPWMEEFRRLQSMGSLRVGHDWAISLSLFTFMHWRRKWQPTPVFLPGESQAWGNLVGCRLWGRTESDTTEAT